MAITFVNKALTSNNAAATTIVVTITPGTGNLVTGLFSYASTTTTGLTAGSTTSVIQTSTGQNVLCIDVVPEPGGPVTTVTYSVIITGSPTSITMTIPGGSTGQRIGTAQVWSGVASATPDGHNLVSIQTANTIQTSGSITTTAAGDLLVGYLAGNWSGTATISAQSFSAAGTGSTFRNNDATNLLGADSSEIQTAAGASTASFTLALAQTYAVGIAGFQAATGASLLPRSAQIFELPPQDVNNPYRYTNDLRFWAQKAQQSRPVTFQNQDWPNPVPRFRPDESFMADRVRFLVQQPASFLHNYDFPNPPPVNWYRSWEPNNALRMSLQPASYFNNYDWPNPQRVNWYQFWASPPINVRPFSQSDWPNPQPVIWYRDWSVNLLQTTLTPGQQNPFVQTDWPNPQPVVWYREFIGDNARRMAQQPASYLNNQDWPNPTPVTWYRDYSFNNLGVITNQPASYFNNQDWPNPPTVQWYRDFFSALVQQMPIQKPFNQTDWPVPRGNPPIDQFWSDNLVSLLSQPNPVPFNQTDWPVPKSYPPIDQFYAQALALNLPVPPPPPIQIFAGRQISPEEALRAWMTAIGAKGRVSRYG